MDAAVRKFENENVVIEVLDIPGSTSTFESNEDKADFLIKEGSGYAWVLDGASALSESLIADAPSDGRWYIERFNHVLKEEIEKSDWNRDVEDILESVIKSVREAYENETGRSIEKLPNFQTPSSTIHLVRWHFEKDELESYGLGDSAQLTGFADRTDYLNHGGPQRLDNKVFKAMRLIQNSHDGEEALEKLRSLGEEYSVESDVEKLVRESLGHEEVMKTDLVQEMLCQHRNMKNEEGGYWTLGFKLQAVEKGLKKSYKLSKIDSLALFTDGVDPVLHSYKLKNGEAYTSGEFLDEIGEYGVKEVFNKIVRYEENDSGCENPVRFKKSDDKALLSVKFS